MICTGWKVHHAHERLDGFPSFQHLRETLLIRQGRPALASNAGCIAVGLARACEELVPEVVSRGEKKA